MTESEAILLCDCAHAKFVLDVMPEAFPSALLLALTADAHGAAVRLGAGRVVAPYEMADYRASLETDLAVNLRVCQEWLAELGLAVVIDGINLAELDGLNQFLFFQQAMYIARTATAMIKALPRETVLRVPVGDAPLAADLYLDSDIAAAVVRHVGETMGYRVEPLYIGSRPLRFGGELDRRPFFNDRVLASVFRRDGEEPGRRRIGFVPSVVSGILDYYATFNSMSADEVTVFASPWADRPPGQSLDGVAAEEPWLTSAREMLDQYKQAFWYRIGQSSLPVFLRDNPYLRFQFDYILTERWLAYARYIYSAVRFVRDNPLDLLIYCDHFVAEGVILAALYRRAGARTAIATHSLHACDAPFVAWHPEDSAIVRSRFSARQALRKGGLAAAYCVPAGRSAPPRATIPGDRPRRILFLGNAVEAPQPLVDIEAYLQVVANLARTPSHLHGQVELTVRLKPGVFSEFPEVHCRFYGVDPQSFARAEGLSLAESIAQADCVVGTGIPTSGYLDVLAQDKPLIHVGMEPYFPAWSNGFPDEIEGCVIGADRLWSQIEALLFDEASRERQLARQRACFAVDQEPSFPDAADPLRAAIGAILSEPR